MLCFSFVLSVSSESVSVRIVCCLYRENMPCLSLLLVSCSRRHLDRKPPTVWWPWTASIPALTHRLRASLSDKWVQRLDGIFAANCLWVSSQWTQNHYECSEIICTAEPGRLRSAVPACSCSTFLRGEFEAWRKKTENTWGNFKP